MTDPQSLLAAYDDQLRTDAETPSALSVTRRGPLRLVTFAGGRGFVTYRDLGGADADAVRGLVAAALDHFGADPGTTRVEWKTRGHDRAPGLHEALLDAGFVAEDTESIMLGEARHLAVDVELPAGVTLRTVTEEADVRAMSAMADEAFGDPVSDERAEALLRRLSMRDGMELWVAEAGGRVVSAGRLEPVPGTRFAGIWGGSTLAPWRGRGIYRALTAAREVGAADGQDPGPQRLHRVLPADPRAVRPGQGVDDDALHVAPRTVTNSGQDQPCSSTPPGTSPSGS